jgi:hypothetical protein
MGGEGEKSCINIVLIRRSDRHRVLHGGSNWRLCKSWLAGCTGFGKKSTTLGMRSRLIVVNGDGGIPL